MYTSIQILSLAALWCVKSVKQIALFFPLILILLVPIRRSLTLFYSESELEAVRYFKRQMKSFVRATVMSTKS